MPAGLALEEDATSRSSRVAHRASGCSTWTLRKVARRRPSRNSSRRTAPCLPPSRRSPAAADGISSLSIQGNVSRTVWIASGRASSGRRRSHRCNPAPSPFLARGSQSAAAGVPRGEI